MMKKNEFKRTSIFVCCGLLLVLGVGAARIATAPKTSADFADIGKPFFPEFTTAADARSLDVYAVDPDSAIMKEFRIRQEDGLWVIPSHYDYPAEANFRIAQSATSLIGVKRDALAGRLKSEHEKFGVVDPLGADISELDSMGKRLTMKDSLGDVLADYIIGDEVKNVAAIEEDPIQDSQADPSRYYYVRRADENQTYMVKLEIDLSTRFSDWIEPDLLQVSAPDISRVHIDNYQLREMESGGGYGLIRGDQITLDRNVQFGGWELEDMFAEQEQLVQPVVESLLGVLDDLRIVGVRPKHTFKGQQMVTADLELNEIPEFEADERLMRQEVSKLQSDLESRGFSFVRDPDYRVVSHGGMMSVGTREGVRYILNFGKNVVGDNEEIEIGSARDDDKSSGDDSITADSSAVDSADNENQNDEASADDPDADGPDADGPDADETGGGEPETGEAASEPEEKNRYLMVRVAFDETLLGPKPVAPELPVEPVMPEGYVPPAEIQPAEDMESTDGVDSEGDLPPSPDTIDVENEDSNSEESNSEADPEAQESEPAEQTDQPDDEKRQQEFRQYEIALERYEDADIQYAIELTRFEADVKAFGKQVEAGREAVDDLNDRYGKWYYVISADNLSALQVARTDLVEPVERAEKPLGEPPEPFHQPGFLERPNLDFEFPEDFDPNETGDVESDGAEADADTDIADEVGR